MKKEKFVDVRRWCAHVGVILLAALVLNGCVFEKTKLYSPQDDKYWTPSETSSISSQKTHKAFVQWSVLPNPWEIHGGTESWDHDGPWSAGSLMLTHSSGKITIDTDDIHQFEASWNSIQGMDKGIGNINFTLNKAENVITVFESKNSDKSGDNMSIASLKGTNIPLVSSDTANHIFEVTGPDTCNHITAIYIKSENFLGLGGSIGDGNPPYVCNENSFIRIQLVAQ